MVRIIRPPPPRLNGFLGRLRGDQAVAAVADQVGALGLPQRLADFKIILRLEKLHQGPLQLAVAEVLSHVHWLLGERVDARVVHGGRHVPGCGMKDAEHPCPTKLSQSCHIRPAAVSKCPEPPPAPTMPIPIEQGAKSCSIPSARSPGAVPWMPSWWSKPRAATAPRWRSWSCGIRRGSTTSPSAWSSGHKTLRRPPRRGWARSSPG